MFSATMANDILELTKKFQTAPVIVNVTNKKLDAPKIQQVYFEVQEKNKPELLARLLDINNVKLALVFCNTKSQVDQLVEILKTRGYFADALHGDMNQNQRDKVMNSFRNGTVEILVATDVAGRGIDVNDVEAVFNYDLPRDDEDYTHRIGRTARAGKTGTAFTFIVGKQIYNLTRIQRANGFQIQRQPIPTIDEIQASRINSYASKIAKIIEAGHLSKYVNQIELLMGEEYTALDVAAALLKVITDKENEGFDNTADFSEPVEELKPAKNKFSDKKFGRKFDNKDGFKKSRFEKKESSFKSSGRKKDDFKDRPFRKENIKKVEEFDFEPEYKPLKSSVKKKSDSTKDSRPSKFDKSAKKEDRFEREKKAFKSAGKKKAFSSGKFEKDRFKKSETGKLGKKFGKSK
jgi:ATP-dependent RNA helicase DeaD